MGWPSRALLGNDLEYPISASKMGQPVLRATCWTFRFEVDSSGEYPEIALNTIPKTSGDSPGYHVANSFRDCSNKGNPIVERNSGRTGIRMKSATRYVAVVSIDSVGAQSMITMSYALSRWSTARLSNCSLPAGLRSVRDNSSREGIRSIEPWEWRGAYTLITASRGSSEEFVLPGTTVFCSKMSQIVG